MNLRHALAEHETDRPHILVSHDAVRFNTASDHWLDGRGRMGFIAGSAGVSTRSLVFDRGVLTTRFSPPGERWLVRGKRRYTAVLLAVDLTGRILYNVLAQRVVHSDVLGPAHLPAAVYRGTQGLVGERWRLYWKSIAWAG